MDFLPFFVVSGVIALLMVIFSLRGGIKTWIYRGVVLALFMAFLPLSYLGFETLTGTSRTADMITLIQYSGHATVQYFYLIKDKGIYFLADLDGDRNTAVYLRLPWDEKLAGKLQEVASEAEIEGVQLQLDIDALKRMLQNLKANRAADRFSGNGGDSDRTNLEGENTSGWDDREPVFHPKPQPEMPPKTIIRPQIQVIPPTPAEVPYYH